MRRVFYFHAITQDYVVEHSFKYFFNLMPAGASKPASSSRCSKVLSASIPHSRSRNRCWVLKASLLVGRAGPRARRGSSSWLLVAIVRRQVVTPVGSGI